MPRYVAAPPLSRCRRCVPRDALTRRRALMSASVRERFDSEGRHAMPLFDCGADAARFFAAADIATAPLMLSRRRRRRYRAIRGCHASATPFRAAAALTLPLPAVSAPPPDFATRRRRRRAMPPPPPPFMRRCRAATRHDAPPRRHFDAAALPPPGDAARLAAAAAIRFCRDSVAASR